MRWSQIATLFFLMIFCCCNTITGDKESERQKNGPKHQIEDVEIQKLRKQQDSLYELRHQKPKKKGLDSLKPIRV